MYTTSRHLSANPIIIAWYGSERLFIPYKNLIELNIPFRNDGGNFKNDITRIFWT